MPPTPRPTAEQCVEAIREGDYDGDGIDQIVNALAPRFNIGAIGYRWNIDLPDLKLDEDGLTLGECEDLESETGLLWTALDRPRILSSAKRWGGFLRVLYQSRAGLSADEAAEKVRGFTALQAAEGIRETVVVNPPKEAGT